MGKALLQVALDVTRVEDALSIAMMARENGADMIEAGTLLIKSAGITSVKSIKQVCRDIPVVADMKVLDTGAEEVELAARNGADIVTVSALAHDRTILDAVIAARNHGVKIMVDFLHVSDPLDRGMDLCELGVDYICIHRGIDAVKAGAMRMDEVMRIVKALSSSCNIPVAVAGGIDDSNICELVRAGAKVLVIGSYITRSADVGRTVRWVKRFIDSA
ncbi:MAG: orotidine 5'-phosphate decarboxylase / HUMPS family protein [Candidatus Nitrosocaldus sp.]|nr:orotidine 5'-phosphate decarboxylase [Candidatus Nitrosocaldus sp.]MDW8275410.1 orotidine 5'-phosphate decarboxylase / HUMPS family protein [Candidatus Nitrosocaldus sp.]